MMIANEIPPYQKLIPSVDDRACLKVYSVWLKKSDLKRRTASLSLLESRELVSPLPE